MSILHLVGSFAHLIPAEGPVALREAVWLPPLRDGVEDGGDVGLGAVGELVVVVPVAGGGRGEHDVVAADASRPALLGIVVLQRGKIQIIFFFIWETSCRAPDKMFSFKKSR